MLLHIKLLHLKWNIYYCPLNTNILTSKQVSFHLTKVCKEFLNNFNVMTQFLMFFCVSQVWRFFFWCSPIRLQQHQQKRETNALEQYTMTKLWTYTIIIIINSNDNYYNPHRRRHRGRSYKQNQNKMLTNKYYIFVHNNYATRFYVSEPEPTNKRDIF